MSTKKKIESLTPEQQALFLTYVDQGIAMGIDTKPLDREKVKAAVKLAYECAGLKAPDVIKFARGPMEGILMVNIHAFHKEYFAKHNKRPSNETIVEHLRKNVTYHTAAFGSHDAAWITQIRYYREVLGLKEETEKILGLLEMSRESGWWWPYDDICIVSEKPHTCKLDDNNVIHSETGPAIAYNDGTEVYAIHGVVVPEYLIKNPEKITLEKINKENNAEIKRIMIDIFGVNKYLEESKAQIVDMDMVKVNPFDSNSPSMPRALIQTGDERYLVGTDGSTKRAYYMPVPAEVKTCAEAHNFISPIDEKNIIASS